MTALTVLWYAFTHAADLVWHAIVIGWAIAYPIWLASVAYNVVCERLQRRRDRRARLAEKLREDVRAARLRELPACFVDESLATFDACLRELELPLELQDPAIRGGAS